MKNKIRSAVFLHAHILLAVILCTSIPAHSQSGTESYVTSAELKTFMRKGAHVNMGLVTEPYGSQQGKKHIYRITYQDPQQRTARFVMGSIIRFIILSQSNKLVIAFDERTTIGDTTLFHLLCCFEITSLTAQEE